MGRKPSPNPGRTVTLYLRGEQLSLLRQYHPKPADAIRQLIADASLTWLNGSLHPLDSFTPKIATSGLCEACAIFGVPNCPACELACRG